MPIRSTFLASALILGTVLPASAAGDNVVLVDVAKVDVPSKLPGLCQLNATVQQVWQGKAFHSGQSIVLRVPCSAGNVYKTPAKLVPGHGVPVFSVDVLRQSKQGLARVDDAGTLIWQPSERSYGPWGVANGYRVLDGALVPVPDRLKS